MIGRFSSRSHDTVDYKNHWPAGNIQNSSLSILLYCSHTSPRCQDEEREVNRRRKRRLDPRERVCNSRLAEFTVTCARVTTQSVWEPVRPSTWQPCSNIWPPKFLSWRETRPAITRSRGSSHVISSSPSVTTRS